MAEAKARAVLFDRYGGRDVLYVAEVPMPTLAPGEVVVAVRAAGINPGEAAIRSGTLDARWPATFPSGEGSDLAGVVTAIADDVHQFAVGDEVLGFSLRRSSHATHVAVPVDQLIRQAARAELGGGRLALRRRVYGLRRRAGYRSQKGRDRGCVGRRRRCRHRGGSAPGGSGADVVGIASPTHAEWLTAHGVVPVARGDGLAERLRAAAPHGIDALIDLYGPEYLDLAVELGIPPDRIETITAFEKAEEIGAKAEGSGTASNVDVLSEMADLVASGSIEIPIAATYPLDQVATAYEVIEKGHTLGKIVLIP